ncbi:sulfotransferase family protein [Nonomuraea sp. SYSU D8015]|uniref:sulfotransferase family protein n=1 Tax=Nonomuraea sp. SYSU D8015 TaxID=2593644 RepID=UPI001660BED8|nr:sulfotransferase [Nonomuraea sp. SYSU D8015]
MTKEPYTLVYLLGSGRNGSTIIDLMLAGHPSILALGELSTLNRIYNPFDPPEDDYATLRSWKSYRRFWSQVKEAYEKDTYQPFEKIDIIEPRLLKAARMSQAQAEPWIQRNLAILRASHAVSGCPVLSDASKSPQRLLLLKRSRAVRIKVIHLVRDGRAVSYSYFRRYGSLYEGMRTWSRAELASLYLRRIFSPDEWMEVRYEQFASQPDQALRDICTFLDLDYHEAMLDFRAHPYLGIGGNPKVKASRAAEVREDDRWRQELSAAKRFIVGLCIGWLNRMRGYSAFATRR